MLHTKYQRVMCALALAGALGWGGFPVHADGRDNDSKDRHDDRRDDDHQVKTVFVVAMENHNWVQPSPTSSPEQIFLNPAAPFINSLVKGTSGISGQVAYANMYLSAIPGLHPSEPNYVWAEAGQDGISLGTDNDPYWPGPTPAACTPDTIITTDQHLSAFLTKDKKTWRSYQEDVNVSLTTNVPLASSAWTVPLFSQSGNFTAPAINEYNFSTQYNYAAKHNPMVFFTDTAGPCPTTLSTHYPPLQQLALDLQNDTVADYNWITPDQFNDQHTKLTAGYGSFVPASDQSAIAQGDNFLARIVPLIMASKAYKDHGVIVLWWDESEGGDTSAFRIPFIIISKDAHENVGGLPYSNTIQYSHSSFLRTMQEIFDVDPWHGFSWLGDASNATDLSDLFKPDTIR
jgi:phosphatidylinositol-3-phosphatase